MISNIKVFDQEVLALDHVDFKNKKISSLFQVKLHAYDSGQNSLVDTDNMSLLYIKEYEVVNIKLDCI